MTSDAALDTSVPTPAAWWAARRTPALAALTWIVAAVAALLVFGLGDVAPPLWALPLLLVLVGSGLGVLALLVRPLLHALRELSAVVAARRVNQAAMARLVDGDGAGAEALWRPLLDRTLTPTLHTVLLHNLGVAALAQGEVERARDLMEHARAGGWFDRLALRARRVPVLQARALVHTILGDGAAALALLSEARGLKVAPAMQPYLSLAEALACLRAGEPRSAAAHADRIALEPLPPHARSLAALVRAWAHHRAGAAPEVVAEALAAAPPLAPDRPRWAATHWPELAAFAAERGALGAS